MESDLGAALPRPVSAAGRDGLRRLIAAPKQALVGLDFDGTLAPIVADPAAAVAHPGAVTLLRRLARHVDAVAIVTGRPPLVALSLLGLADPTSRVPANLMVLGHYGLECWTPASGVAQRPGADLAGVESARAALPRLLEDVGAPAGTSIEDKGVAVAVHVRGTPDPAAAMELLRRPLGGLAEQSGLRLEPGRLVLELRPTVVDKGEALEQLAVKRSSAVVMYVGDDLGDLAAFDALDRLRVRGVAALSVCSGSAEVPQLRSRADLIVDGPDGVVALLGLLCDALD